MYLYHKMTNLRPTPPATPAWKIELELGNKEDLLQKGKARMSEAGRRGNEARWHGASGMSQNDKPDTPHSTRNEIAKSAGVSTGQVGMAERLSGYQVQ